MQYECIVCMYVCVCVILCMYVMYVCVYVCMHVCMYACMYQIHDMKPYLSLPWRSASQPVSGGPPACVLVQQEWAETVQCQQEHWRGPAHPDHTRCPGHRGLWSSPPTSPRWFVTFGKHSLPISIQMSLNYINKLVNKLTLLVLYEISIDISLLLKLNIIAWILVKYFLK